MKLVFEFIEIWVGYQYMRDSGPEVRLWMFDLDGPIEHLEPLLSADERARAQRFIHAQDRNRYIAGRGTLRMLVGSALGSRADRLEIVADASGKPRLASEGGFEFNLSHSNGFAVLAASSIGPIGIDLEAVREVKEAREIASTHFCSAECAYIDSGQTSLRFLRIWTRKEACVKALGAGLTISLKAFDTTDLSEPKLKPPLRVVDVDLGGAWLCALALPWQEVPPSICTHLDWQVL